MTLTNMRPAANEAIDALWGQNLADSTGYNFYRQSPGPSFDFYFPSPPSDVSVGTYVGTKYFYKRTGMGTLFGSYSFINHQSQPAGFEILVNGVSVKATSSSAATITGSFAYDISGLSNESYIPITFLGKHGIRGPVSCSVVSWMKV